MTDNYAKIVQESLDRLCGNLPKDLAKNLPGEQDEDRLFFDAFGEKCVIHPNGITLGEADHSSVFGILITLYALNKRFEVCFDLSSMRKE